MLRADAVVLGRGPDIGLGIGDPFADIRIGRDLLQERLLRRISYRPIFINPGGASGNLFVAHHIEQRHLNRHRLPQIGPLGELDPHQQAAIGAAIDAQLLRAGNLARGQVVRHRDEIVIDDLALGLAARVMPFRPELAAAADIGEHERTAPLRPHLAGRPQIGRQARDLETAISGHQRRRRAVELHTLGQNDEVGHLGAIARRRLILVHGNALRVEARRQALDRARRGIARSVEGGQRGGRGKAVHRQEDMVAAIGRGRHADADILGHRHRTRRPARTAGRKDARAALYVVDIGHDDAVLRRADTLHRLRRARREQHLRTHGSALYFGQRRPGDGTGRDRSPRVARLEDHAAIDHADDMGAGRNVELLRAPFRGPYRGVAAEKRLAPLHQHQLVALGIGHHPGIGAQLVTRRAAVQFGRGG